MAECLMEMSSNNTYLSIGDYEKAYDNGTMKETLSSLYNSTMTSLPDGIFTNCSNLKYAEFANVRYVGSTPFSGCINLKSLYLNGVKYIDRPKQFAGLSNLENIEFHPEVEILSIATEAFLNCSTLSEFALNCNLLLPQSAFKNCYGLKTISITTNYEYAIYKDVFMNCSSLEEINLRKCKGIYESAFANCINLKSIELLNVSFIKSYAFNNCKKLDYVSFGNSISYIPVGAFNTCINLRFIDFKNISSIGANAFRNCTKLSILYFSKNVLSIDYDAFTDCPLEFISAPNLTVLQNIPFPKSYYMPNILLISRSVEAGINSKVILNFSLCERVDPGYGGLFAGFSAELQVSLPNCSYYKANFGSFLTYFNMPNLFTENNSHITDYKSSYGWCTFAGYYNTNRRFVYYSDLRLSYLYVPNLSISIGNLGNNFPTPGRYSSTYQNLGLNSCIEVLGFNNIGNMFHYLSYNDLPICSKLRKIFINNYTTDARDYTSNRGISWVAPNLKEIELITDASRSTTALQCVNNNLDMISANYNGEMTFGLYNVNTLLSFPNITSIYWSPLSGNGTANYSLYTYIILMNSTISKIEFPKLKYISPQKFERYYCAIFGSCSNLEYISLPELETSNISPARHCQNLKEVYMPKVSCMMNPYFLEDCGYINNLNMENCFNDDRSLSYVLSFGMSTEFYSVIYGTKIYCDCMNAENLHLPNCSMIDMNMSDDFSSSYFPKRVRNLYAPKCNYINYWDKKTSYSNSNLNILSLSEYVDYFKLNDCTNLPSISFKTSSDYYLNNSLYNCSNLQYLNLQASGIIDFAEVTFSTSRRFASRTSIYHLSSIMCISTIYLKANSINIPYSSNIINFADAIDAPYIYSNVVKSPLYGNIISISANTINIEGQLLANNMIYLSALSLSAYLNRLYSPLIILDTNTYINCSGSEIGSNKYISGYKSNGYVFDDVLYRIVKVRSSLLSLYQNDPIYMSFSSLIGFIEL